MNYGTRCSAYGTGEGDRGKCAPQLRLRGFSRRKSVAGARNGYKRKLLAAVTASWSMKKEKRDHGPVYRKCGYNVPLKSPGDKERGVHHVPARGSGKPDKEIRDALHEYVELQKPTIHAECVMPRLLS